MNINKDVQNVYNCKYLKNSIKNSKISWIYFSWFVQVVKKASTIIDFSIIWQIVRVHEWLSLKEEKNISKEDQQKKEKTVETLKNPKKQTNKLN